MRRDTTPSPGSQTSLREANRSRIVAAVKRFGGLTQVELAAATGLSTATVSTIVKELVGTGVVETETTSRSGRRALRVTIARSAGLVAGIHIGPRSLAVALGDLAHDVVAEQALPLPADHRPDTSLDRAALLIVDLLERVGTDLDGLLGVGVAIAAPVESGTGLIAVRGALRGWEEVPVAQVLTKRLARPVHVESDAGLGALAEHQLGAGRYVQDVLYVRLSYGTSAGLILGGRLHHGGSGAAGQLGHVQVSPAGPVCSCGNRGCLDTEVGEAALLELLRPALGEVTLRDVVRRAQQGDPGCARVLADAARLTGEVVAGVVTLLDPQVVVVGGELARAGDGVVVALRESVHRHALPHRFAPVDVVAGQLGPRAELIGALELARKETDVEGVAR
ncbi:ROK family transcriptional regulator [Xylanimonas allomyrinae]|uniref:ROK family transcriptional regulator n=1 Tax=Xylanimonas allomyrinae TaxID=2509459 RepID=A0A4P6EPY5_9MICO|nr:ROK family transcriptional regulator [Xylanimonas allomyrinae]